MSKRGLPPGWEMRALRRHSGGPWCLTCHRPAEYTARHHADETGDHSEWWCDNGHCRSASYDEMWKAHRTEAFA